MEFPWEVCYIVQFRWLQRDPLGDANYMTWCHWLQRVMTYTFRHCTYFWPCILCRRLLCAGQWEDVLRWVKSPNNKDVYFKVWMFKLSQLSKFLQGGRRKKFRYLLSKFRTKSSVNTSIASRFQTIVVAAFKLRAASITKIFSRFSQSRKYLIDLCWQIKPIAFNFFRSMFSSLICLY